MSEENIKLLKKVGLKITEPRLTILALMQKHLPKMSIKCFWKMVKISV